MTTTKTKRRRKKLRRDRNRERKKELLRTEPWQVRKRKSFFGKSRRGDAAALDLTFSGTPVPVDLDGEKPSEDLARRHAAVEAWNKTGNPTSGEA